jgi:hypothetical protein
MKFMVILSDGESCVGLALHRVEQHVVLASSWDEINSLVGKMCRQYGHIDLMGAVKKATIFEVSDVREFDVRGFWQEENEVRERELYETLKKKFDLK